MPRTLRVVWKRWPNDFFSLKFEFVETWVYKLDLAGVKWLRRATHFT